MQIHTYVCVQFNMLKESPFNTEIVCNKDHMIVAGVGGEMTGSQTDKYWQKRNSDWERRYGTMGLIGNSYVWSQATPWTSQFIESMN